LGASVPRPPPPAARAVKRDFVAPPSLPSLSLSGDGGRTGGEPMQGGVA
jgi:hypothetical protein